MVLSCSLSLCLSSQPAAAHHVCTTSSRTTSAPCQQPLAAAPRLPATGHRHHRATALAAARAVDAAAAALAPEAAPVVTLVDSAVQELRQAVDQEVEAPATKWWEVDCPPNMSSVGSLQELVSAVEAERSPTSGRLVVVNYFAPECYACKSLQPKLRQIARNNPGVLFVKVNGMQGDLQAYCEDMGITRIPYFHIYRANKRVAEFTANMRPEKLAMLRAEIAAHKPQAIRAADTPQYAALEA